MRRTGKKRMPIKRNIIQFSTSRPGLTALFMMAVTLLSALFFGRVGMVNTNPLDILPTDDPARLFQQQIQKEFGLHDQVMIGVFNTKDKDGVFNPQSLKKIVQLSRFSARILKQDQAMHDHTAGELIAPDTVDSVVPAGLGRVHFQQLMAVAPTTRKEALIIRDRALKDTLLRGTIISNDGKSLALYLPIARRDFVPQLQRQLQKKLAELSTHNDKFLLAGPPIVENTAAQKIRSEIILAVSLLLTATGLLILLVFLPNIGMATAPPLIALCTVVTTMGLFVGTGNTLYPASLFIPLILLPAALAYSMHFLACCRDTCSGTKELRQTLTEVISHHFFPMLTIAVASAAGFGALIFTEIPPLRTFGIFVAIGILLAWLFTISYLPAHLLLIREKIQINSSTDTPRFFSVMQSFLRLFPLWITKTSTGKPWWVFGFVTLIMGMGAGGILMLQYTTRPMAWFPPSEKISNAERMLNKYFNGTDEVNLILSGTGRKPSISEAADQLSAALTKALKQTPVIQEKALAEISQAVAENNSLQALAQRLSLAWQKEIDRLAPEDDAGYEAWSHALDTLDRLRNQHRVFKQPELLQYLLTLQKHLNSYPKIGGSMSVADIIRKVHQGLFEGDPGHFTIPATVNGVTQTLVSYQTLHTPDDLRHLVNKDFTRVNVRLFLKGNNDKNMKQLVADTNRFLAENPPPVQLTLQWSGSAYINMVTKNIITTALHKALVAGYLLAFVVIALIERSLLRSMPIMIPPLVTLGAVYGSAGLIYGEISVPTAMLMFLPMVMAIHCSIPLLHELTPNLIIPFDNSRKDEKESEEPVGKQAPAIFRETIILSLGCLPLIFFPLVPLQRAGILCAATMFTSGAVSLWAVPALATILKKWVLNNQAPVSDLDT